MLSYPELKYVQHSEIDVVKWDNCINRSDNGLIYAQSFFLNKMADQWDAIILGDYEAVMPLPWRKKFNIRYVYQVAFLQRLGIFSNALNQEMINQFSEKAASIFKFIYYKTDFKVSDKQAEIQSHINYILPLSGTYQNLYAGFSAECRKNIRKAASRGCTFLEDVDAATITEMYKAAYSHLQPSLSATDYNHITELIDAGKKNGLCEAYGVADANGKLVFSAAIFKDKKRLYYTIGSPNEQGRQIRATYFFINALIEKYAGSSLVFDFEGSDIPNVASFYQRFSPQSETYYTIKLNQLPWPLNLIKK